MATFGSSLLTKAVRVGDRYYWRLGTPGFPSPAVRALHLAELNRLIDDRTPPRLRTVFLAITKKCTMRCAHCFEWENLRSEERLSVKELMGIVLKFQDHGTGQIMLSGGEPLLRPEAVFGILKAARPGTDFWVITSGLGLDRSMAGKLKGAGLTGVMVSLDDYREEGHDAFRGYRGAYRAAVDAARWGREAGLATALALCARREMAEESHLKEYLALARSLGVTFVQFIEPRSTGRYAGKDVELDDRQLKVLEKIYLQYNATKACRDFPIINYLGFHQRRTGCFGGGNRFFYIDTDGDAHLCPYCHGKIINVIRNEAPEVIEQLTARSCHAFQPVRTI